MGINHIPEDAPTSPPPLPPRPAAATDRLTEPPAQAYDAGYREGRDDARTGFRAWLRRREPTTRAAPPPPQSRRSRAWLLPAAFGAMVAALLVSNYYETATLGQRVDATLERGAAAVRGWSERLQSSADRVASESAQSTARAAGALTDAGITANIKTALAADPDLSALKIEVDTTNGIVTLRGPAPSGQARERATVLAQAPQGVVEVRNELVLSTQTATAVP